MIHGHTRTIIGILVVLIVLAAAFVLLPAYAAPKDGGKAPKLSQASLDLDTKDCPTVFGQPYCEKQTEWSLEKTTDQEEMVDPDGEAYLFDVTVVEGPTGKTLMGSGQIVITNSGELSAVVSSLALSLEEVAAGTGDAPGPSGNNWKLLGTAIATESSACDILGEARTCYGKLSETEGATLVLYDPDTNDTITLADVPPIPATLDNDDDGLRDEDCPDLDTYKIDNDDDGYVDEDPINGIDDDGDDAIDEDPGAIDNDSDGFVDEDCDCEDAVRINFDYEFDITGLGIEGPGDSIVPSDDDLRLDLIATFGSAGKRGGSGAGCTFDVNCNNEIDDDDPDTPYVDESEKDNIRSIQQRLRFDPVGCDPVCDEVELLDTGAVEECGSQCCLGLTTTTLNELIAATGVEGTTHEYEITGTVSCECKGPQDTPAPLLYGTDNAGVGDVYSIVPSTGTATKLVDIGTAIAPLSPSSPNGNAYDLANNRLYLTNFEDPGTPPTGKPPSKLYFVDLSDTSTIHYAGTLEGHASDGTFYDGAYWYIGHGNNSLQRVDVDASGYVTSETTEAVIDLSAYEDAAGLGFGDIEFDCDGTLYISSVLRATGNSIIGFLTGYYDLDSDTLHDYGQDYAYQLAIASDGKLYGHETATGKIYEIDKSDGSLTLVSTSGTKFTDLTANRVCASCACSTKVTNNATLTCEDESLISGSPASASFNVTCTEAEACVDAPADMVSWWTGDTDASDSYGDNDGVLLNDTPAGAGVPGKVDGAFSCNSANEHMVEIADDETLHLQEFTLDAWVNLTSTSLECIICKQYGTGNRNSFALLAYNGKLAGYTCFQGISSCLFPQGGALSTNEYVHVAQTWNGSMMILYINGVQVKNATGTGTVQYDDEPVLLCADDDGTNKFVALLDGIVDEAEIFDRALTQEEIQAIYDAGSDGKCK